MNVHSVLGSFCCVDSLCCMSSFCLLAILLEFRLLSTFHRSYVFDFKSSSTAFSDGQLSQQVLRDAAGDRGGRRRWYILFAIILSRNALISFEWPWGLCSTDLFKTIDHDEAEMPSLSLGQNVLARYSASAKVWVPCLLRRHISNWCFCRFDNCCQTSSRWMGT